MRGPGGRVRVIIDGTVLADITRAIELRERGSMAWQ